MAFISALYTGRRIALVMDRACRPIISTGKSSSANHTGAQSHGEQNKRTLIPSGGCLIRSSWNRFLSKSLERSYSMRGGKEGLQKGQPSLHVSLTTCHKQTKDEPTPSDLCQLKILTWAIIYQRSDMRSTRSTPAGSQAQRHLRVQIRYGPQTLS